MKERLYSFIEKNFKDRPLKCIRRRNGIIFMKDEKNGFYIHIYRIIRDTYLCNGCFIREGRLGRPFFLDKKEQFICTIFYDEEKNDFEETDINELFYNLYKYYIKLYILPFIEKKEVNINLQLLSFFNLSTRDIFELKKYFFYL